MSQKTEDVKFRKMQDWYNASDVYHFSYRGWFINIPVFWENQENRKFLDNIKNVDEIKKQLKKVVDLKLRKENKMAKTKKVAKKKTKTNKKK